MTFQERLDISVIIPFKNKSTMTLDCVKSLLKYGAPVKEIILVSNNSSPSELSHIEAFAADYSDLIKVLKYDHPFNYQKMNNWAIKQSSGKVVYMLNNDVELIESSVGLMEEMYKLALKEDAGEVGCVLLYGDRKTIQHAGVYLVPGGFADHIYQRQKLSLIETRIKDGTDLFDITQTNQVTCVTGASVMIERKKFDQVGSMNERFIIGGGDVDLGIRLMDRHYKNLLVGSSSGTMLHKESVSRKHLPLPYVDFWESYKSYVKVFDIKKGDPFLGRYV